MAEQNVFWQKLAAFNSLEFVLSGLKKAAHLEGAGEPRSCLV